MDICSKLFAEALIQEQCNKSKGLFQIGFAPELRQSLLIFLRKTKKRLTLNKNRTKSLAELRLADVGSLSCNCYNKTGPNPTFAILVPSQKNRKDYDDEIK